MIPPYRCLAGINFLDVWVNFYWSIICILPLKNLWNFLFRYHACKLGTVYFNFTILLIFWSHCRLHLVGLLETCKEFVPFFGFVPNWSSIFEDVQVICYSISQDISMMYSHLTFVFFCTDSFEGLWSPRLRCRWCS